LGSLGLITISRSFQALRTEFFQIPPLVEAMPEELVSKFSQSFNKVLTAY
jgi:hypothetical protein